VTAPKACTLYQEFKLSCTGPCTYVYYLPFGTCQMAPRLAFSSRQLNRRSSQPVDALTLVLWLVWYLSMTRIQVLNIPALGLQLKTHRLIQGILDPLFKVLYMASMSMQTFPFLSAVRPHGWFALEPFLYSIVVFRIVSHCSRDKYNNKCFWEPSSNLGVFCRQQ